MELVTIFVCEIDGPYGGNYKFQEELSHPKAPSFIDSILSLFWPDMQFSLPQGSGCCS